MPKATWPVICRSEPRPRRPRAVLRRPPARRPASMAGFSLPELMMVVAVAGILLTVALPNFVRFTARDRVATAADDLGGALMLARQKALAHRVSYRVTVSSGPTRIVIERKAGANWVADPAAPLLLHDSVHLQARFGSDPHNSDLLIDPQGMLRTEDAPAVFAFSNDRADSATVRMVRTGRIRTRAN